MYKKEYHNRERRIRVESVDDNMDLLLKLVKCFAAHWGDKCEIVLHDLKNHTYENSIVAIENGHVTGRKIGGMGSNLGLEVLRGTELDGDKIGYVTHTPGGKVLRSTSIYIRNDKNEVIGSICINHDITELIQAERSLAALTHSEPKPDPEDQVKEYFAQDVNDLLNTLIRESVKFIGKSVANMTKEDKIEAISYLDRKGAFLIKKSMEKVARYYKISRYTIYNYLEKTRGWEE